MTRSDLARSSRSASSASVVLKRSLADRIVAAVERRGLTVREAQALTGHAAADFSRLRTGELDRFTIDRLLTIVEALGERVIVSVLDVDAGTPPVPAPLRAHLRDLRALCRRFAVRRLGAFGSVIRQDFDIDRSDIDLTVEFGRSRIDGPADQYFRFKSALEELFGREVDLVELDGMPDSRLKRSIGRSQVMVYEQVA